MPKTATPRAATTTAPADNTPNQPGELIWVDPNTLEVDPANKRSDLGDLTELTTSIAALGVLEPLVARPDGDTLNIIAGQRRQAAAIAASKPLIPVIVRPDLAGQPIAVAISLVENEHRKAMTDPERARAYQQMRLDGLSVAKITKITGTKRAAVNQALTVGGNELAVTAAERYQLSMDQAVALAEFSEDHDAIKALVATAKTQPGRWDHLLARLREDRDAQTARDATVARLTEAGIAVIDSDNLPESAERLARLLDPEGQRLDPQTHASCPGHAEAVDPWNPERTVAYCTDPQTYGHATYNAHYGSAATRSPDRGPDGKLTEEARAERRRVIEGNKAWRAARKVRQAFLRDLLARRTPPKTALRYVTETVLAHPERVGDGDDELVGQLLGTTPDKGRSGWGREAGPAAVAAAPDTRLPLILLAQVAADAETALHDHAWREARPTTPARWLAWLASIGYHLSDIETQVVTAGTATTDTSEAGTEDTDGADDDLQPATEAQA